jgi:tRNA/rRNA methyltransferase
MIPMQDLAIVLVEPQSPGNIGMVCRAMINFGVSDLRLVNPCAHLHPEAHKLAVGGAPLLGAARLFPTLETALADLTISVAATRRAGRLRGELLPVSEVPALCAAIPEGLRAGFVFGREDAGLTSAEVALCSHAAVIPTNAECGSLNLAQAVLVFLYEHSRSTHRPTADPVAEMPRQGELEELFVQMEEILQRIAFLNPARPEGAMHTLRRIHQRSGLDRRELQLLRGMWSQLAWSIRDWRGRKRGHNGKPSAESD